MQIERLDGNMGRGNKMKDRARRQRRRKGETHSQPKNAKMLAPFLSRLEGLGGVPGLPVLISPHTRFGGQCESGSVPELYVQ